MTLILRSVDALFPYGLIACRNSIPRATIHIGKSAIRTYSEHQQSNSNNKNKDVLHKFISKSRLLTRLNKNPKFSKYFDRISEAGAVSTITSFVILHELSAIVPLFGLWWIVYQLDLPDQTDLPEFLSNLMKQCGDAMERFVGDKYTNGVDRHRLILSGAISYTIIKLLYPLRIIVSLWAAPYFGKWLLLPFQSLKKFILKPKVDK